MTSEFNDRPLVAGSIRGVRSFRIDSRGVLTGVMHQTLSFKRGMNFAVCLKPIFPWQMLLGTLHPPAIGHQVGQVSCTCGYYAYFEGSNDYRLYLLLEEMSRPGHIAGLTGIIEGSGVVTVGSRGFRAEKAELVALVEPEAASKARPTAARTGTLGNAGLVAWDAFFGVRDLVTGHPWLAALMLLLAVCSTALSIRHWRRWQAWRRDAGRGGDLVAKVRANYPGVPWYPGISEALEAHPLTPPPPAEVESNAEAAS